MAPFDLYGMQGSAPVRIVQVSDSIHELQIIKNGALWPVWHAALCTGQDRAGQFSGSQRHLLSKGFQLSVR